MKQSTSPAPKRSENATDERLDERFSEFRAADLMLGGLQAPVACLVKDSSPTGLRLTYDSPHKLPQHIRVVLHHPSEVHQCEVIWNQDNEIGLRILAQG